jgi:hypothetical protein
MRDALVRLAARVWIAERHASGRCGCGRTLIAGRRGKCGTCLSGQRVCSRRLYRQRRDLGLCVKCGEPAERSLARCRICDEKRTNRERIAA